jgi:hypothetical protein
MQETQALVSVLHISNPSIPCSILQSIAQSGQYENDGKDWVRRMGADNDICDDLACWSDNCDPQLSESHMDLLIQQGGCAVAYEGSYEHE